MRWIYPCDPECPGYRTDVSDRIQTMVDDPMTEAMGAPVGDFAHEWEGKHRLSCKRCQEYGAANAEVGD